jgi:hypothetical protein
VFDRDSCRRLVEEPNTEGRNQHNTDHHGEQESRDIGRAELSDAWHGSSIISKRRISDRYCARFGRNRVTSAVVVSERT